MAFFPLEYGVKAQSKRFFNKGRIRRVVGKKIFEKERLFFLTRNWRSKRNNRLEIDLIFKDDEILVFVEVRARSSTSLVSGYESINSKKRQTLKRAFMAYLREESNFQTNYRFDVVEIDLPDLNSSGHSLYHHENIAIF